MADRPKAQPRPQAPTDHTHKKETADQRRERQREAVIATQIDLKREAAERRARKSKTS
jgi:hypothetical protein